MLAGCSCASTISSEATTSRCERMSRRSTWLGRMPVECRPYDSASALVPNRVSSVWFITRANIGENAAASAPVAKKPTDFGDGLGESTAQNRGLWRERGQKPRRRRRFEDHEAALVALAADEAAERLLEPEARELVVIAAAESGPARLMENGGPRPRHLVEHGEPEAAAWHVDAVAQGIGAEQAGIFFTAEKVDEGAGLESVDV